MASTINAKNTSTGVVITPDASGQLELQTADTTRMTIDVNGNVGVGTSSPSGRFDVTNDQNAISRFYFRNPNTGSSAATFLNLSSNSSNTHGEIWVNGSNNTGLIGGANAMVVSNLLSAPLVFSTNNTERMRIDSSGNLLFNSGYGSVATAYGCRAWVNFNGTGTVAIRASGNVTSITDNGVGIYTINFTNAMPDVNYAVCASGRYQTAGGSDDAPIVGVTGANFSTPTTSAVQIGVTTDTAAGVDPNAVYVSVFR